MRKILVRPLVPLLLAFLAAGMACANLFNPSSGDTPAQIEQKIFKLVNDHRLSIGAVELIWNDTIAEQARLHSQDMASGAVPFGHDGSDSRFAIIGQTIPWHKIAEIVALAPTPQAALDAWLASAEHKPYIEDGVFRLTGVGVAMSKSGDSFYATQIFVQPR
jgi:uncharacterized protein YkwD